MKVVLLLTTVFGGLLFTAGANAASVPLVNINPATDIAAQTPGPGHFFGFDETNCDCTVGWTFTVTSPIVVTDVGWYDKDGDGLSQLHLVGLWKSNGQLSPTYTQLFSNNFSNFGDGIIISFPTFGITAPLDGPYRKVAIPSGPLTLSPGEYILGGTDSTASPTDVIRYALD